VGLAVGGRFGGQVEAGGATGRGVVGTQARSLEVV